MIVSKPTGRRLLLLFLPFFIFCFNYSNAQGDIAGGKAIFNSKCASCHQVHKDGTGPALAGVEARHKWADHGELLKWINNPAAYIATDAYTRGLVTQYGSMMQAFPDFTMKDVEDVVAYINSVPPPGSGPKDTDVPSGAPESNSNAIIFGIISLILAIIALILMQVNSNLKKMSDDVEGIMRPDPVPFYRNKVYIATIALLFFAVAGFYFSKAAIGFGRQKDYQPVQPIYYSHKVHAGINQISCLYCHGPAQEGKQATIPSVNICMNCHISISEYTGSGGPLYREDGTEIDGTAEIQKLYKYAGWDPQARKYTKPATPVEWVRIHNLPDHVYFNHSQHVKAGNVQCQTCHGPVQEMGEVYQFTDLSMGWCVNCHRETKVQFTSNKFYSIYEKFHEDLKKNPADSVTVEKIGGTECQKCHY